MKKSTVKNKHHYSELSTDMTLKHGFTNIQSEKLLLMTCRWNLSVTISGLIKKTVNRLYPHLNITKYMYNFRFDSRKNWKVLDCLIVLKMAQKLLSKKLL